MTRKQWGIVFLIGIASAVFFFSFTVIWLTGAVDRNSVDAARGPGLWDAVSIMAGTALGTMLHVGLRKHPPRTTQVVIGITVLLFLGVLTFLPWSDNSPIRSIVLPLMELSTAAWMTAGANH